jgi:hypothetical protein
MARKAQVDTTSDGKRQPVVQHWLSEIAAAKKREKDFRKEGERILEIYGGKKKETTPFNVLFSNTETLLPALYSAVPRPVVQRRFKDSDPLGKLAATAGARCLEFLVDTNVEGYETFDEGMRSAVLDALLPGRGVTCVKYDAEIGELPPSAPDADGTLPVTAGTAAPAAEATPYKQSELACIDTRSWNRVYFGYAKKWSKVPWIAYEDHIDKEEAIRLFGADITAKIVFTDNEDQDRDEDKGDSEEKNKGERKTACVYQIWDRDGGKKIRYISAQYNDGYLREEDDPLGLTGFFNCPRPIQFLQKSNDLLPVALYALYENQAKELNELTKRINRIARAIKAKAIYDSSLGDDIKKVVEADDNELVPADSASALATEKGLQNAIWFWPVEKLIVVLRELYAAREACKQVIYEITGIADIMRGQTNASETLGAQEIKQSWGTLRLKRLQKEVQRYARDLLRMMLEIAATKFSEDTWAKMTGLPFVTTEQHAQLESIAAAAQQSGVQLDPQTQAKLQAPVWGQVLEVLRDDTQRAYRIDIETNSTVEAEATEDQKNIAEVMNAMAQYLNGVTPLVIKGALPFEAAQSMLLAIVRRFRFGPEIEDYVKAMKAPEPEGKEEAAAKRAEMQMKQQEGQQRLQEGQMKLQAEQMKGQVAAAQAQAEIQRIQLEASIEMERLAREREAAREEHAMKMAELRSKHEVGMAAGQMKLAQMREAAKKPQKQPAKV